MIGLVICVSLHWRTLLTFCCMSSIPLSHYSSLFVSFIIEHIHIFLPQAFNTNPHPPFPHSLYLSHLTLYLWPPIRLFLTFPMPFICSFHPFPGLYAKPTQQLDTTRDYKQHTTMSFLYISWTPMLLFCLSNLMQIHASSWRRLTARDWVVKLSMRPSQ